MPAHSGSALRCMVGYAGNAADIAECCGSSKVKRMEKDALRCVATTDSGGHLLVF
jgi:hypothetical protein